MKVWASRIANQAQMKTEIKVLKTTESHVFHIHEPVGPPQLRLACKLD